jgi:hypothetical protein
LKFYILDLNNEFRELKARVHQICEIDLEIKSMYNKLKAVGIEDINNNKQNKIHEYEKNERESEIKKVSTGNQF